MYQGDGFVSDGLGRITGISMICLYLGGGLSDGGGGLDVMCVVVVVQRSA